MRSRILFILVLLSISLSLKAQNITGVCLNNLNEPVGYVNIGVRNTNVHTISNSEGLFSIEIPEQYKDSTVVFAHISYQQYEVIAKDFRAEGSESEGVSEKLKITLNDNTQKIDEVVVTANALKIKRVQNLNPLGFRMPGLLQYSRPAPFKNEQYREQVEKAGINFGTLLSLKERTWIQSIELNVARNSFDTLIMRVVVYKKEESDYTPLIKAPIYVNINKSGDKQEVFIDLSDENIVADGSIYVGLDAVYIGKVGTIGFPMYKGGNFYQKSMATGQENKQGYGIGFQVKGRAVE